MQKMYDDVGQKGKFSDGGAGIMFKMYNENIATVVHDVDFMNDADQIQSRKR